MSCFASEETLYAKAADPTKHVNYVQGMVLGVDDFNQEFAYLSEHDQSLARDLIGYGTVTGLAVAIEDSDKGKRVAVSPGVAISPRGQLIRVAPRQCAVLNDWLNRAEIKEKIPAGSSTLQAYVVLCYRDCPTDDVPILGEPCRTEEESMAPSRIVDDFRLELRLTPPEQSEEDALRDFIAWLRQVEIADFTPDPNDLRDFLNAIRDSILPGLQSPPASPLDFFYGNPPAALQIPSSEACEWLRSAFRLWVTELRPLWQANWAAARRCDCASENDPKSTPEECLLLAELQHEADDSVISGVPLLQAGPDWTVDPGRQITTNQERRPYLLHLRMLQEWLICGHYGAGDGPANGPQPATELPVAENAFGGAEPSTGTSLRYAREDHTHGTPPDPIPAHVSNPDAHAEHNVAGDVRGTLAATSVTGLQGVSLFGNPSIRGQVLTFTENNFWEPRFPAVEHSGERYFIVAAGRLQASNGDPIGPVYNKLRVVDEPALGGFYLLTFGESGGNKPDAGYVQPPLDSPTFMYIVKGTPVVKDPDINAATFTFNVIAFEEKGILVRVIGRDNERQPESFMIEISLFGQF